MDTLAALNQLSEENIQIQKKLQACEIAINDPDLADELEGLRNQLIPGQNDG